MPQTIMSVDGDAAVRSERSEVLRTAGFGILEIDTGADVLRLASEHQPTLIVLAIGLSGADGFTICGQLKADPRTASIPVLHIHKAESPGGYLESLESGAEGYLPEPVEPSILVGAVTALIRRQSVKATTGKGEQDAFAKDTRAGLIESIPDEVWFTDERKRAEAALRESEQRFRCVVENMSEGLLLFDAEGNLTYQNPASLRIHGFGDPGAGHVENENLPATWKGWDDTGRPMSFEEWPISRVLRRERFQDQTLRAVRVETGQEFYASYNGCPIVDANGRLAFGFITIREITEQRKAEMALRESEERLRLALAATELGAWDYDPVTGALAWDARCKELFGLPPEIEVNYIVDDLDALLDRLKQEGVKIDAKRMNESYGRFAWIYDLDGNKIELWQPAPES